MFCTNILRPAAITVIGAFGLVALSGGLVGAQVSQTSPGGGAPAVSGQNCAVSTSRIGSVDVTQFFGMRGGAASFGQNFAASSTQAPASELLPTPAQRCIRLEVENPTPGDMIPVGGYVLGGFAFDPTAAASQGSGISSIQVFLDDPNEGGSVVGQTGTSSTANRGIGLASARGAAFGDQFANSGFQLTAQIPSSAAGSPHALFVVALSSAGRAGSVALPVVVGDLTPAVPTRTP